MELVLEITPWSQESASVAPTPRFRYLPTVRDETPAPVDLGPSGVFDSPTGQLAVSEPPDVIIRKAAAHIQAMAMLRIDPDADERVDRLVSRRLQDAPTRPLKRKV
jgi:hypothetical protein